jgi:hypothetical protein
VPSEIRQFKFMVSWLCFDRTAVQKLCPEISLTTRYVSTLFALLRDYDYYYILLISSRELVGDSRMGTAIGPRSREMSPALFPLFSRSLRGNGASLFYKRSSDVDLLFAGFSYSGPRRWNFSHPMK